MRWITFVTALALSLTAPTLANQQLRGNATAAQAQPRVHQEVDPTTRAVLTASADGNGNAVFTARLDGFLLEKAVSPTGESTLRLTEGNDVVTIATTQDGFAVARGGRTERFNPRGRQPAHRDAIQLLLVGSPAVRAFKRLSAAIENRDETEPDSPLVLGLLVDSALVQMLDGDPGAGPRIAKRITRKQRIGIRKALAEPSGFRDCVWLYEVSIMRAWEQYTSCYVEAQSYTWPREFIEQLCSLEWLIRTQQYIWQFASCMALPV